MHDAGMRSTGKRFPGHGGVYEDSHLQLPIDNRSMEDLIDSDIKPYTELKDKLDIDRRHIFQVSVDKPDMKSLTEGVGLEWTPLITGDMKFVAYVSATFSRPPLPSIINIENNQKFLIVLPKISIDTSWAYSEIKTILDKTKKFVNLKDCLKKKVFLFRLKKNTLC